MIVEILGLGDATFPYKKKIITENNVKSVEQISPYLTDGSQVVVSKIKNRYDELPPMSFGSMANDGGNFILSIEEYKRLNASTKKFTKKIIGSKEFINSTYRYCIWLYGIDKAKYKENEAVSLRVNNVKRYRESSKRKATQKLAAQGELFGEIRWENKSAIIVPRVSSQNRLYVPMGYVQPDVVISDSAMAIYDAPLWLLGLLESRMHMTWLRAVGGRLKTDYRYSASLVYNTFPVPNLSTRRKNEIEALVWNILDIRDEEGGTLAELYGAPLAEKSPKPMNSRLLAAHQELDQVVDRAYRDRPFKDDSERLSLLLDMYRNKIEEWRNDKRARSNF